MLLMEVDGDELTAERDAQRIADVCDAANALTVLVAQTPAQRDNLWSARREMSSAIRRLARHKISEDVVVPRQKVAQLLERVSEISERESVQSMTYGHAGDGNLHVNFLWDTPEQAPAVSRAIEALFRATVELRGTLSGEHGIGLLKAPYLSLEQSADLIQLQRELKAVFDPKGLLNPGKIFPRVGHGPC